MRRGIKTQEVQAAGIGLLIVLGLCAGLWGFSQLIGGMWASSLRPDAPPAARQAAPASPPTAAR